MATSFTSLPVIDVGALKDKHQILSSNSPEILSLAKQLSNAFATSGFAYLTNLPLSFTHDDVFELSKQFFTLPIEEKMKLGKKSFVKGNENTYRGYFPTQPGKALDNLKEGFEIGSGKVKTTHTSDRDTGPFNLYEPNIWPSKSTHFTAASRRRVTQLYGELQALSSQLLSLLAVSLDQPPDFFADWLLDSLSTLRLLHYPPVGPAKVLDDDTSSISSGVSSHSTSTMSNSDASSTHDSIFSSTSLPTESTLSAITPSTDANTVKLSCTPHTDSGILTLLHQDPTGGLEVLNSTGSWIPAPYVPNTIVVNIGDLMAKVSGGRWVATMHRVRAPLSKLEADRDGTGSSAEVGHGLGMGRFSVPFFFEPGEECWVRDLEGGDAVRYGVHVRQKMKGFVEFQDEEEGIGEEEL